ncbi:hypothetical protein EH228_00820 [Erwinia endophytica]|nr:hypothetical protein EH228_00820 [Erwinia endophytica]
MVNHFNDITQLLQFHVHSIQGLESRASYPRYQLRISRSTGEIGLMRFYNKERYIYNNYIKKALNVYTRHTPGHSGMSHRVSGGRVTR